MSDYRNYFGNYLPPWLQDAYGTAWGQALGDVKDGATTLLRERVAARLPVRPGVTQLAPYAPRGALEATGRDRRMPRAVGEDDASYAERLAAAWDLWESGGTPLGALRALRAAGYPEAQLVIRSQRLYRLDAAGELVVEMLPSGSWAFEPEPQSFWSRYAVLFAAPNLPPSWAATTRTLLPREDVNPSGWTGGSVGPVTVVLAQDGAAPPAAYLSGSAPVPALGTVFLTVSGGVDQFIWESSSGAGSDTPQDFYPGGSDVVALVNERPGFPADVGVSLEWVPWDTYVGDDKFSFDVAPSTWATSAPPTATQTGSLTFTRRIEAWVTQDGFFGYSVNGVEQSSGSPMNKGTPVPLFSGAALSGVSVTWPIAPTYPGARYAWQVLDVPAVPAEDSPAMNVIRALTKEWSNAAATLEGVIIAAVGGVWGYPVGAWGDSGDTWGGDYALHYHP